MTLDAAFVLVVAGAAMVWPPLALIVGGAFLGLLKLLEWKLSAEPGADAPTEGTPQ